MLQGKTWCTYLGSLAVAALLVGAVEAQADGPPLEGIFGERYDVYEPPQPAPDVAFEAHEGGEATLADYEGEVIVLNFWATWCAPCVEEMPTLDNLQAMLGDEGLRVMAVSQDRGGREQVEPFLREKLDLHHLGIYLDQQGELGRAFDVRGLPATFVINAEGQIVGKMVGPADWDSDEVVALVNYYLDAGRESGSLEAEG